MIFDSFFRKGAKIGSSRDLLDEILRGTESASGVSVGVGSIQRHAPVVAIVGVMQRAAMQLPVHLFRRSGTNNEIRQQVNDHPLSKILRFGPNESLTMAEWIGIIIKDLMIGGNHYAFINRISSGVYELIPLQRSAVDPFTDTDGNLRYRVTLDSGGQDVLMPDEVLHFRINIVDGVRGQSPFLQARDSTGLGIALERYASRLFKNSARPSGLLTAPALTPEQVETIRNEWEQRFAGTDNAHKTAVLTGGLQWVSMSMSSEDAQFIETRRVNRNELAGLFGVPPHMIGGLENATFSNIEHQAIEFVIHALNPMLVNIEQRMAKSLLTEKEREFHYFKFNVNAILRGDMKTRGEFYTRMIQNGALSPNELRALEDMNPREGGDVYLTPMNMNISENGKTVEQNA